MSSLARRIQKKGAWVGVTNATQPKTSQPRGRRRGKHKEGFRVNKK